MANSEWGSKRTCQSCGARFYDLRRTPAECPKCGAKFEPNQIVKSRRPKAPPAKAPPVVVPVVEDEAKKIEPGALNGAADAKEKLSKKVGAGDNAADDDDEAVIEDASELGEDEDDVSEVRERASGAKGPE